MSSEQKSAYDELVHKKLTLLNITPDAVQYLQIVYRLKKMRRKKGSIVKRMNYLS